MTVLQVSGPAVGGIRVHLWQLIERLPAQGFRPFLAAPVDLPAPPGTPRAALSLGERLHPLRDLRQVADLSRLCQQIRPAVVHAHGYKAAVVASVAGVRPLVLTFHNLWPREAPRLAREGLRWAVRSSEAQIGVSNAVLDSVASVIGPLCNRHRIPNSIDLNHFCRAPVREVARESLGLPARGQVVGFAGRLMKTKGPQVLIDAAAQLVSELPEVSFAIAGAGPDHSALRTAVDCRGLGGQVYFLGSVPDVRILMAASDVWAIPSLAEGGGIVALEAMAAGVPIVASAVGGLCEVLDDGKTAILVPADDARHLAAALSELLRDPERAESLRLAAHSMVTSLPDADDMAREVAECYRACVRVQGAP